MDNQRYSQSATEAAVQWVEYNHRNKE